MKHFMKCLLLNGIFMGASDQAHKFLASSSQSRGERRLMARREVRDNELDNDDDDDENSDDSDLSEMSDEDMSISDDDDDDDDDEDDDSDDGRRANRANNNNPPAAPLNADQAVSF